MARILTCDARLDMAGASASARQELCRGGLCGRKSNCLVGDNFPGGEGSQQRALPRVGEMQPVSRWSGGRNYQPASRAIIVDQERDAIRKLLSIRQVRCGNMAVSSAGVINVDVVALVVAGPAAEIDVAVVVLPLHVMVVQQRARHGQQQRVQGYDYAGAKEL